MYIVENKVQHCKHLQDVFTKYCNQKVVLETREIAICTSNRQWSANETISLIFSTALMKPTVIHYRQKLRLVVRASVGLAKMRDLK